MADALIGHTGFVGQNLLRQRRFEALYRSTDIEEIEGRRFGRVVCAGVNAVKWRANADPDADLAGIERLMRHLDRVDAEQFVLISSVDVYGSPIEVDEADAALAPGSAQDQGSGQPYGLHRAMLERWVRDRFPRHHVVRLPALFGQGLKKNALFDLLHDNRLACIDQASRFQWYPLSRLADDLDRMQAAGLALANLATEPVTMEAIRQHFFPTKHIGGQGGAVAYDVRTRHGRVFGGGADYVMAADEVMAALGQFLTAEPMALP